MTDLPFELARKLNDAGWPQPYGDICDPAPGEWVKESPDGITRERDLLEKAYSPTLSELIAACPKKLYSDYGFMLHWVEDGEDWLAFYHPKLDSPDGRGPSPEVAVARLWLALKEEGKE